MSDSACYRTDEVMIWFIICWNLRVTIIRIAGYQKILNAYNMARDLQGKATDAINEFVRYRNKAFEPLKPDAEIQAMVDVPEELINRQIVRSIASAPHRKDIGNLS